jgi:hypothetical protein
MQNYTEQGPSPTSNADNDKSVKQKVDRSLRKTAQRYLNRTGVRLDLAREEEFIRLKPLQCAAIAVGIGFILGGGVTTRLGIVLFGLFGRRVFRDTASDLAAEMIS